MSQVKVWRNNAETLALKNPVGYKIFKHYCAVLRHIHETHWTGACHASSGIFVALLRASGIPAEPYIGECEMSEGPFDHSWVEIEGDVYDCAISNPLEGGFSRPPVFRGIDLASKEKSQVIYGVRTAEGYGQDAKIILDMSFNEYMNTCCPWNKNGFWGVASEISKVAGERVSITKLKKHSNEISWRERT